MQNQVTIFEAIALGGDLNLVANREEIRLIRQHPSGTKIHSINLLDENVVGRSVLLHPAQRCVVRQAPSPAIMGIGITGAQTLNTIVSTLSTSAALILSIISLSR